MVRPHTFFLLDLLEEDKIMSKLYRNKIIVKRKKLTITRIAFLLYKYISHNANNIPLTGKILLPQNKLPVARINFLSYVGYSVSGEIII